MHPTKIFQINQQNPHFWMQAKREIDCGNTLHQAGGLKKYFMYSVDVYI